MSKKKLIEALSEGFQSSKKDALSNLNVVLNVVTDFLIKDGKVKIPNIGTLSIKERGSRKGINPQTKKNIFIPAKKVIKFKAGKEILDMANKK